MKIFSLAIATLKILVLCTVVYASEVQIVVRENNTNIMASPSQNASVLTTENFGAMFVFVSEQGEWYRIVVPNRGNGYILKSRAMVIGQKPVQQQPQPTPAPARQQATPTGIDPRRLERENRRWREYRIENLRHVRNALDKANEGIDGAIEALANALEHRSPQVRSASADALVSLGLRSISIVGKRTEHNLYIVKTQAIDILARIGEPAAVPYLSRALADPAVSEAAARALAKIPGSEAKGVLQRHRQQADMQARISEVRRQEEERRKRIFTGIGIEWSDTRTNILNAAMRIAQYRRSMPTDPRERNNYNSLRELFHILIREYNEALGENSALRLLKDNGYTEDILK